MVLQVPFSQWYIYIVLFVSKAADLPPPWSLSFGEGNMSKAAKHSVLTFWVRGWLLPGSLASHVASHPLCSMVLFWCYNLAVVKVINRQTSSSEQVMQLVQKMVLTCLLTNISFSAKSIPGTSNGIMDPFHDGMILAVGTPGEPPSREVSSGPLECWPSGSGSNCFQVPWLPTLEAREAEPMGEGETPL